MIDFGRTLRNAREAKGYTIKQMAEKTRILETIIQNLEDERFDKIVAPIYGRGFVKLYCKAVDIDPEPLIAEFMDIYNGNRDPAIKERVTATKPITATAESVPTPEPEPKPLPTDAPEPEPEVLPMPKSATAPETETSSEPIPVTDREPPAPRTANTGDFRLESEEISASDILPPDGESDPPKPSHTFARYASPINESIRQMPSLPAGVWRITIIAAAVIVIVWGAVIGIKTLHRTTSSCSDAAVNTSEIPSEPETNVTRSAALPAKPEKRTPRKIAPLYID